MTNINCTLNCQHQKDGKCILETIEEASSANEVCAYYTPPYQKSKKNKAEQ